MEHKTIQNIWRWLLCSLCCLWLPLQAHASVWKTAETTHLQFRYPARWASTVNYLIKRAPQDVKRLEELFGYRLTRKIQVRISSPGNAFAEIQPHGWRPDSGIAGLAYPKLSLITMKIRRIEGLSGLHQTFVHELCHILFAHASQFRPLPLWLNEGTAMWLSNDYGDFERFLSLSRARSSGHIPTLTSISKRFPAQPEARKLAYGTSLDITLFLRKQRDDFLPVVMKHVRAGMPWQQAIHKATGTSWQELAASWRKSLSTRYGWLPLIANEGTIWILTILLFAFVYTKVKRQRRLQWAQLEDPEDQLPSHIPHPANSLPKN